MRARTPEYDFGPNHVTWEGLRCTTPAMKNLYAALACAVIALSSAGCLTENAGTSVDDDDAPLDDDTVVYDTVATVGPDGEVVMSEPRAITVREQRDQNQARLSDQPTVIYVGYTPVSASPEQDFACAYDSLWLYSRTDFSGDRICFKGTGSAFAGDFSRFVVINGRKYYAGTWEIPSGSFLVGIRTGRLSASGYQGAQRTFGSNTYAGTFSFPTPLYSIWLQ